MKAPTLRGLLGITGGLGVAALFLLTACMGAIGGEGGGGDDGVGPPPTPDPTVRCEESKVGPPVLRRLTREELQNTLSDVFPMLGGAWSGVKLGPDPLSGLGFGNDADTLMVSGQVLKEVGQTAEEVAGLLIEDARLSQLLPCATATPDAACRGQLVEQVGRRLFRRALSAAEVQSYVDYFASVEQRADFRTGVRWTLVALIESPHTLYRTELGEAAGGRRQLTRAELASALSYTFAASPPSEDLLARAEAGMLDTPEARVAEARALLETSRGREVLRRFLKEWTGHTRTLTQIRPDVPGFEPLRPAMVSETERFFDEVVYARGGDVKALLTADFTFLDAGLATFYGFGTAGDAPVTRPAEWGIGLLAQGSILSGRAHAEGSSPTLRGLFVTERLLCRPRPPVPANIPPLPPVMGGTTTTRDRYEKLHASGGACQGCHQQFDPVGFAFEHFDSTGRYRADEGGLAIDTTGYLWDPAAGAPGAAFDGQPELASKLAADPVVTDCVSGLFTYYAFGGGGGETCLAEDARAALATGEIGLLDFAARLAGEPHFAERE